MSAADAVDQVIDRMHERPYSPEVLVAALAWLASTHPTLVIHALDQAEAFIAEHDARTVTP